MQTLGLSDSTPRSESRLKSLFWPSIQSGADVDYLAVQGFWVCTAVGVISFVFVGILSHQPINGVLIFLLFHLGGVGVREHNPFAAAVLLVYYTADLLAAAFFTLLNAPGSLVLRVVIMALLISNLRATWMAGKWKPESEEAALPPRLGDTFGDKLADRWPAFLWPKIKIAYYIFSVGYLAVIVAGLIVLSLRGGRF
jgi:hypothetical protein